VIEGVQSGAHAKAWADYRRLNQKIGLGATGTSSHGDDEFRCGIIYDEKSVAFTVSYRKENDAQYRVMLEEKGGHRRALAEGGLASTGRSEGGRQIVEDKKMLSRAEFDRIAAWV
jgi:hypothetical protein